jgi:predicted ATPase
MLNYIEIKNFKSIASARIKCSALTLLAGANGSGKSSVIQSLLLLKQSFFKDGEVALVLNGDYAHLGRAQNIEYNWSTEEDGIVATTLAYASTSKEGDLKKLVLKIPYEDDDDNRDVLQVSIPGDSDLTFVDNIHYLSADRAAPSDIFPYSSHKIDNENLGVRGEYTTAYLSKNKLAPLRILSLAHPLSAKQGVSTALLANVQAWMQVISPGVEIAPALEQKINASVLEYKYAGVSDLSSFNVGFGITYVLPVVTRILMSKPGDIIVLDNPEAHVHPRGQVELGRLIALSASYGVQIIVETHSDHLFNGIRLHIKNLNDARHAVRPKLNNERDQDASLNPSPHGETIPKLDYSMYYVERKIVDGSSDGRFATSFEKIELADDAKIQSAPSGFFDEWENTIFKLL